MMVKVTKKDIVKDYLRRGYLASSVVVSERTGVKVSTTRNILSNLKKEGFATLQRGKTNRWKIVEEDPGRQTRFDEVD
jgi:ribosomal protein S25